MQNISIQHAECEQCALFNMCKWYLLEPACLFSGPGGWVKVCRDCASADDSSSWCKRLCPSTSSLCFSSKFYKHLHSRRRCLADAAPRQHSRTLNGPAGQWSRPACVPRQKRRLSAEFPHAFLWKLFRSRLRRHNCWCLVVGWCLLMPVFAGKSSMYKDVCESSGEWVKGSTGMQVWISYSTRIHLFLIYFIQKCQICTVSTDRFKAADLQSIPSDDVSCKIEAVSCFSTVITCVIYLLTMHIHHRKSSHYRELLQLISIILCISSIMEGH